MFLFFELVDRSLFTRGQSSGVTTVGNVVSVVLLFTPLALSLQKGVFVRCDLQWDIWRWLIFTAGWAVLPQTR